MAIGREMYFFRYFCLLARHGMSSFGTILRNLCFLGSAAKHTGLQQQGAQIRPVQGTSVLALLSMSCSTGILLIAQRIRHC
jgi:hypothetical protein